MNIHAGFTPAACRAARAALDLTQEEVARRAGISRATLVNFEAGKGVPLKASVAAIRRALGQGSRLAPVLRQLHAVRPKLEAMGVLHLAVFGSVARMEDGPDSDVDLVVEIDPQKDFDIFDLAGIAGFAQDLLGCDVDVVERKSMKSAMLAKVEGDQVHVF
ncbi:nucleotidyltransferase domain-containing protein [Parvibaculum sp.]|uniref:nucleotidyltransferase domain-containing protein n=1 Tax=Parvibaculum sp. TaxID=2024848 RepID=UPI002CD191C8|nr:nucleotidyltransferase domain-containing protein [Parvibaculum sp.]HUD49989.1 nucleotidyltransferase domain-containing protein [Parvibaculum sp.]